MTDIHWITWIILCVAIWHFLPCNDLKVQSTQSSFIVAKSGKGGVAYYQNFFKKNTFIVTLNYKGIF